MNSEKITEGKTKIIWTAWHPELVLIESKDIITAGDGIKRHVLEGKGALSNQTAVNCFQLLKEKGIPNHFILSIGENVFLAKRMQMIPLESVARRIAAGSYLQRYPKTMEGTVFKQLKHELFYKDNQNHDPLVEYDYKKGLWRMYDAHLPKSLIITTMDTFWLDEVILRVPQMKYLTKEVFKVLEKGFSVQGIRLKDLKIEFGLDMEGRIMVADVIDADSWRTDPPLDKQKYRDLKDPTPQDLESIKTDYQKAAILTRNFTHC